MAAPIPKINDQNEIIGETTITEAKQNGWPRRIARVFIFDEAGNMLLQKRNANAPAFPGLWDQSAGGHIDVGESGIVAATREMQEEIGVDTKLTTVVEGYKPEDFPEHVFNYVYRGVISAETVIVPDPDEVSEVRWLSVQEFEVWLKEEPELFVPPFIHTWKIFRDKLIP